MIDTILAKRAVLLIALLASGGCYYTQAARGQIEILRSRQPIEQVLADPATPPVIAERLRLVQQARAYSIDVLGLPDNDSYQAYADLERDYVVWNVFAAGEFSLEPKQWCYPLIGCVAYRGYFERSAATRQADKLASDGFDVYVGGVAAYSTLGKFDDPVLSTMMRWDDTQLAGVLFHELAHQLLYIRDDTGFNESFATTVEEIGVERFFRDRGPLDAYDNYLREKAFRRQLQELIDAARHDLGVYYAETIDPDEKRLLKEHRLERLTSDLRMLLTQSGRDADGWLRSPFNNARLAASALYERRVPAFRQMLADCGGNLPCFYQEAERVSKLEKEARDAYLDAMAER